MAEGENNMAKEKNVEYIDCTVTCACGETFTTKSTKDTISVETCSKCHPFYTGQQRSSSKSSRVEKFNAKYGLNKENK